MEILIRMKSRLVLIDVLAILFGISSWISINGLWVELPLLVNTLPESWSLASYLSVIVQIANLGPITYCGLRWMSKGKISDNLCISILLLIGTTSSFLLSAYWAETTSIGGVEHSTWLFVLVFFLSLVDCTSSVLFLPFMAIFRDIYLNSYLIGEGLSGFIPSVVAIAQGTGGNPYCQNVSINASYWEMQTVTPDPRFSVEVFFDFLAAMMVVSLISFLLLNYLPQVKEEHASKHQIIPDESDETRRSDSNVSMNSDQESPGGFNMPPFQNEGLDEHRDRSNSQPWLSRMQRHMMLTEEQKRSSKLEFFSLLAIQTYVCFLSNGAFPSIQTYSCLPYGNTVYHLAVTLNAMANPIMAFSAFFIPCKSVKSIGILTGIGSIFGAFILATALSSPNMLWGQTFGGFLTVTSWVVYGALFSYVKVAVFGLCRQMSTSALFWCGAVTQLGSALGALLMFILVNVASGLFVQYYVEC